MSIFAIGPATTARDSLPALFCASVAIAWSKFVPGTTGTQPNHPGMTVSGVSGTWDVWVDSTNPPCISYVSHDPTDGLTFDLNKFIQDSVTNSYGITNSMYLSVVFGGFEVWSGGDGLQLKQFCATVN